MNEAESDSELAECQQEIQKRIHQAQMDAHNLDFLLNKVESPLLSALHKIVEQAEILVQNLDDSIPPIQHEDTKSIHNGSTRLHKLVHAILKAAHVEVENLKTMSVPPNLSSLVACQEWLTNWEQLVKIRRRQFETDVGMAYGTSDDWVEFMAFTSHELRTPLSPIFGFSAVLLQEIDGSISAKQRTHLEIIHTAGKFVLQIINNSFDLAKIILGYMTWQSSFTNLQGIYEWLGHNLDNFVTKQGKNMMVQITADSDLPQTIRVDGSQLRQILGNLGSNAVKFTEKGQVEVKITAVSHPQPPHTHQLTFTLHDTGPGLPPDHLSQLQTFFAAPDITSTPYPDFLGFGLLISKGLADLMQGTLQVTSQPGQGTTFTLTLPVSERPTINSQQSTVNN